MMVANEKCVVMVPMIALPTEAAMYRHLADP